MQTSALGVVAFLLLMMVRSFIQSALEEMRQMRADFMYYLRQDAAEMVDKIDAHESSSITRHSQILEHLPRRKPPGTPPQIG